MKNRRLNDLYYGMKYRCYNPKSTSYKHYGLKGIKVCDEWLNDFQKFYDWAMANGYQDNLTIDRINSEGNYEPSNCRWVTKSFNSARVNNKTKCSNNIDVSMQYKKIFTPRKKLIDFRKKTGLPQYIMAKKIGTTPYRYNLIEQGKADPSYKNMVRFYDEFHCKDVLDIFRNF